MRPFAPTAAVLFATSIVATPVFADEPAPLNTAATPPSPPPASTTPAPPPVSTPPEAPPETPPMEAIHYDAPRPDPEPIPGAQAGSLLNRFSGSYVDWWNRANVEYFGLGTQYSGGEDFAYTMGWSLSPSFFAYREGRHQVRVRTSLSWSLELTNSNTTTQKNEVELHDLPLIASDTISLFAWGGKSEERPGPAAAYNPTLGGGGENNTWLVPSVGVVFPTSKSSQLSTYLATSLGVALRQRFKLLGGASPGLQSLTLSLGEGWRHDFNKSNVPVSDSTVISRLTGSGDVLLSDQVSKWLLVTDRLYTSAGAILPLYKGLELSFGFLYLLTFKPKPTDGCVQLATGCVEPTTPSSSTTQGAYTDIDLQLAYRPIPELVIGLGYETFRSTAVQGNSQSNLLYSPTGSTFYLDVGFFPIEIGKRFQKPAPPPEPPLD